MQADTTLGRRFTLLQQVDPAPTHVERWIADDTRLAHKVTVDVISGDDASRVRQAAVRAAQVRDARFARIVSTGRHVDNGESVAYVVSERPRGVSAAQLLGREPLAPAVASTLVGEAARALETARKHGVSHGAISPDSLVISPSGRVMVVGLGVDGPATVDASTPDALSEAADARALSRLYVQAVTGLDIADTQASDIPEGLGTAGTSLAHAVLADDAPVSLNEIATAMGPAQVTALRRASAAATSPASVATPPSAPSAASAPVEDDDATSQDVAPLEDVADELVVSPPEPITPDDITVSPDKLAEAAFLADDDYARSRVVASPLPEPRQEELPPPDPKEEPLRAWDGIVAAQNARPKPSVVEATTGALQRLWPHSEALQSAHVRAHARAQRSGPLNVGPLVLALMFIVVMIIVIIAYKELTVPATTGDVTPPPNPYPSYTYSPPSYPSSSPSTTPSE